jgi:hypothetical protein
MDCLRVLACEHAYIIVYMKAAKLPIYNINKLSCLYH